ncbi:MAG: mandelate racemase/muconate lactonizing enzyme family protein [Rhodospirillales bacterium]|nr:mandelate racemase/muconate lactonizing enzyme family protein [Rhodospirillales bacterium]
MPYEDDIRVFTAVSKPVDTLQELYLHIRDDDGFDGLAEVRANIEFLTHIPENEVPSVIRNLVEAVDWSIPLQDIYENFQKLAADHSSIARAAVESALTDGLAKQDGVTAAEFLGGHWVDGVPTSNCLFWGPDDTFERLAKRYVGEGFRDLKVRIAVEEDFHHDLARLNLLRDLFGDDVRLAVDVNGAWSLEEAKERLKVLEGLNLAYVEQPTAIGDWDAFARAGRGTAIPIMADENLKGEEDFDALARLGPPFFAHLKIAKMGGPRVVVDVARRMHDAGVGVMVGQMNEGAMATALTVQCAMAAEPEFHELYGCYGLLDDPASGVLYADGRAYLPRKTGIGLEFDSSKTKTLWEVKRS